MRGEAGPRTSATLTARLSGNVAFAPPRPGGGARVCFSIWHSVGAPPRRPPSANSFFGLRGLTIIVAAACPVRLPFAGPAGEIFCRVWWLI